MHGTLRHWLDRGVDGFRADVVHLIGKGDDVDILTTDEATNPVRSIDQPLGHDLLARIRSVLDGYEHAPMIVGEVNLVAPGQSVSYLGSEDRPELHLSFDFRPLHADWDAAAMHAAIAASQHDFAEPHWPTWVLSNHDERRLRARVGSDARARAAAVVTATVRGTPFLYAGEELGLDDCVVPPDRIVDSHHRDGCRAPIPWTKEGDDERGHGWPSQRTVDGRPWLPFPANASTAAADAQVGVPGSMHTLYRRLLAIRRSDEVLRAGTMILHPTDGALLRYERTLGDGRVSVAVNMSDEPRQWPDDLDGEVLVSSGAGRRLGAPGNQELAGCEAVVVRH